MATLVVGGTAAVAFAAVVQKSKFSGSQASMSFSATASVTCADGSTNTASTFGFMQGAQSVSKTKGSNRTFANGIAVDVFSFFNGCTGQSIGFSEAGIADAFDAPNKKLKSAVLDGDGLLQDFDTGAQFPIDVDVTLTGTGDVSASSSTTRTVNVPTPGGPVEVTIDHSSNSNRAAVASGTLSIAGVVFNMDGMAGTLLTNGDTTVTFTRH